MGTRGEVNTENRETPNNTNCDKLHVALPGNAGSRLKGTTLQRRTETANRIIQPIFFLLSFTFLPLPLYWSFIFLYRAPLALIFFCFSHELFVAVLPEGEEKLSRKRHPNRSYSYPPENLINALLSSSHGVLFSSRANGKLDRNGSEARGPRFQIWCFAISAQFFNRPATCSLFEENNICRSLFVALNCRSVWEVIGQAGIIEADGISCHIISFIVDA